MPEPIPPTGTATPPPAPTPPVPAPAPTGAGAPPPDTGPGSPPPDDNPFAELDAKFAAADVPPPTTTGKPPAKPAAKTGAQAQPPAAKPQPTKEPPELRNELNRLRGELETRTKAQTDLENKIREFEARGKDTEALTKRLADMEKELEERRAEIRMFKQEASPEFKKEYEEPFATLAEDVRAYVEQLEVAGEDGSSRKATWEDFIEIYQLNQTSPQKAIAKANQLFGVAGNMVATQMHELKRLADRKARALQAERENYAKREQEERATRVQRQQQLDDTWKAVNRDLEQKNPDFHDDPDDKEAVEARQKALAIIDAKPENVRQKLVRDAHIRQRAAAYGVFKLKIARLEAEIAALKGKLGEDNPPGKTTRPSSGGTPPPERSWEDDARATLNQ